MAQKSPLSIELYNTLIKDGYPKQLKATMRLGTTIDKLEYLITSRKNNYVFYHS